jgi:AAHS family 4-hydroxybenzoate transporter-like MFS transporter
VRGTGVSWALGIGRVGSIVGSMAGGLLLSLHLGLHNLFMIVAIPAFIGAVSLAGMGKISKPAPPVVVPSSGGIAACQEN